MLQVEDVSKCYQGINVLDDVNLQMQDGDFVVLTGRSGGGKTTFLSIAGALTSPDSGTVILDGEKLDLREEKKMAAIRNAKIGFVFQFPSLVPTLTALDNVLLPIAFAGRNPSLQDLQYARELMRMVGMEDRERHFPAQLSGGQQRRTALARSMINRPRLLIADEPTGDLDEKNEAMIMGLFRQFNQSGTSILMVTHALNYIDYGTPYELKNGKLQPYAGNEAASQGGQNES